MLQTDQQFPGLSGESNPQRLAMLSLQIKGNNSQGLCWHTFEFESSCGNISLWGHTGGDPGIETYMFFNPTNKIGMITFQNNSTGGTFKIIKELYLTTQSK